MSSPLFVRFSGWPAPLTPESEILFETPSRERQMIQLAKNQIINQKEIGGMIVKSNLMGANMVANEIQYQTAALEGIISKVGDQISSVIQDSAEQVCNMMDMIGNRICASLDEVRWELVQQNAISSKILSTLRESRSNEARQLVNQGVRHYINGQYDKAEERFKEALKFDTTDYQVLKNLAFIEMRKGNASLAYNFLTDALNLPDNLDVESKTETLWAMARLRYSEKKFDDALSISFTALKSRGNKTAKDFYMSGIYSVLAGKNQQGLEQIRKAIELDNGYFSIAALDPDLEVVRHDIFKVLSALSVDSETKLKKQIADLEINIEKVNRSEESKNFNGLVRKIISVLDETKKTLTNPSYSRCLESFKKIKSIPKTFPYFDKLIKLNQEKIAAETLNKEKQAELNFAGKKKDTETPLVMALLIPFIIYIVVALGMFYYAIAEASGFFETLLMIICGAIASILWPLAAIFSDDLSYTKYPVFGYALALVIISIIGCTIWHTLRKQKVDNINAIECDTSSINVEISSINDDILTNTKKIEGFLG